MKELPSFKEPGQAGCVVNSSLKWKATTYHRHRCEPHWQTLIEWLESNGTDARKKFHELRKLLSDAIVKWHRIFAGSVQLRHSTTMCAKKIVTRGGKPLRVNGSFCQKSV